MTKHDEELLQVIKDAYKKVMDDKDMDTQERNERLAYLMTHLETIFWIPLFIDEFDEWAQDVDNKVIADFYLQVSNARDFSIYPDVIDDGFEDPICVGDVVVAHNHVGTVIMTGVDDNGLDYYYVSHSCFLLNTFICKYRRNDIDKLPES